VTVLLRPGTRLRQLAARGRSARGAAGSAGPPSANLVAWLEGGDVAAADNVAFLSLTNRGSLGGNWTTSTFPPARSGPVAQTVGGLKVAQFTQANTTNLWLAATLPTTFTVILKLAVRPIVGAYDPCLITGGVGGSMRLCSKLSGSNWGTFTGGGDAPAGAALTADGATFYTLAMVGTTGGGGTFYRDGASDGTFSAAAGVGDLAGTSGNGIYLGQEPPGWGRAADMFLRRVLYYDAVLTGPTLTAALAYAATN
jgi:hypothetical protein